MRPLPALPPLHPARPLRRPPSLDLRDRVVRPADLPSAPITAAHCVAPAAAPATPTSAWTGPPSPLACCAGPARPALPPSFPESSDLLAELAGVSVEARQIEHCAEALGQQVATAECDGAFPCEDSSAPTMYLGLDGTGLPIHSSEAADRAGQQADGSTKTREPSWWRDWAVHTTTS